MKSSDKMILLGVGLIGVLAAVWFLAIAPKREQAAALEDQVAQLEQSVATQETLAAAAQGAEASFDESYSAMIRLGKAVPAGSDQASLIEQVDSISRRNGADFIGLNLSAGSTDAATTAAVPEPTTAADGTTIPATETDVALTPLGATVGPAGLATMPYELTFNGDFLELADFFGQVDGLVSVDRSGQLVTRGKDSASGRLLTINGFSLSIGEAEAGGAGADGDLEATVSVTSYLTPEGQGVTAGATPAGPAVDPTAAPTATADAGTTTAPTAAVTP